MIKTVSVSISEYNMESKRYSILKKTIELAVKKLGGTVFFTEEFIKSLYLMDWFSALNAFSENLPKNYYIEDNIITMNGKISFFLDKAEDSYVNKV